MFTPASKYLLSYRLISNTYWLASFYRRTIFNKGSLMLLTLKQLTQAFSKHLSSVFYLKFDFLWRKAIPKRSRGKTLALSLLIFEGTLVCMVHLVDHNLCLDEALLSMSLLGYFFAWIYWANRLQPFHLRVTFL